MKKIVFIKLLFIFFLSQNSWSQQYFFKNFSTKQGLPQSSVFCMIQDSIGYIWIGTDGSGVCRYDGRDFEVFNKTNGLSGNIVRSLFQDSKQNIWIGTDKGVTIYDGFKFSQIGIKEGLTESAVLAITEDSSGIIWVGTNDKGLFRIENKDSLSFTRFTMSSGLVSNFIFDIQPDNYGRIWLAMVGGINVFEFIDGKPRITRLIKDVDIPSDFVISAEKDYNGDLWFGTNGNSIFKINVKADIKSFKVETFSSGNLPGDAIVWDIKWTGKTECWIATNDHGVFKLDENLKGDNFTKENGLLINQILKVFEDREGNMWFASLGNGLMMFENKRFVNYNSKSSKNSIRSDQVFNVLIEGENSIYTGTDEGLYQFQLKEDQLLLTNHYNILKGLPDNNVNALTRDKNGLIWIGTNNGVSTLRNGIITQYPLNNEFSSRKIHCILNDSRNNLWIGTDNGYNKVSGNKMSTLNQDNGLVHNEVQTIIEDRKGTIWMGTLGGLVRLHDTTYNDFIEEDGLQEPAIYSLAEDKTGNIWIGTVGGGIYKFDIQKDSVPIGLVASKGVLTSNEIYSLEFISDTIIIAGEDIGFDEIMLDKDLNIRKVVHYGMEDGFTGGKNNINSFAHKKGGYCWFGTSEGLVRYNPFIKNKYDVIPKTLVTGIKLFFEEIDWAKRGGTAKWFNLPVKLVLPYKENHLIFKFSGIYFQDPLGLQYSYFLEGQSKDWSPYSYLSELESTFPGLSPGSYKFLVKCRNKFGVEGQTAQYGFLIIKPPFWKTPWFISSTLILLIFAVYTAIRLRIRNLQMEKIRLEKIVEERTKEVVEQKNEIERQRDIVIWQKQEITDSINYAKKIQSAVLPDQGAIKEFIPDYFVLFKPKDIVSGDFYWVNRKDDYIIFIAADCTGHGVPGAFMSMLGVSFLNEIINQSGIVQPDLILNRLRKNVLSAFRQHKLTEGETKDGMDIAVCSYDIKKKKLLYAGANNPFYLVRKVGDAYQLMETPADKMPVAYYVNMTDFTNHEIDIQAGDTVYIFSDGFRDQFGGPEGKKFMKKNFQNMFLENQSLSMAEQLCAFEKIFQDWVSYGESEEHHIGQIDDVLVMGVRF